MSHKLTRGRMAVFIDRENISHSFRRTFPGRQVDYLKLRQFLDKRGYVILAMFYTGESASRRSADSESEHRRRQWVSYLGHLQREGYQVVEKPASPIYDGALITGYSANCDVEIATDFMAMVASGRVEEVVLVSGDGDFVYPVRLARSIPYCTRVTVMALREDTSMELQRSCDEFIPLDVIADEIAEPIRRNGLPQSPETGPKPV